MMSMTYFHIVILYLFYSFSLLTSVVYCLCVYLDILSSKSKSFAFSDNFDADRALENSLYAKEKIISELNVELHKLENTLSSEREEHINEIKKLNSLLNEKVYSLNYLLTDSIEDMYSL